ncbi:MAG: hypothetical protein LUG12_03290 [Erysipelotrichaceae bacterium]|nr:hypothetical protein [Erysipelotrichaceae bacterium]
MEYFYQTSLNNLKDLKHIEWFIQHYKDYIFSSELSQKLFQSLTYKIQRKNIYYADIVREYHALISLFENNPYNYQYDVLENKQRGLISQKLNCYFVDVKDSYDNHYQVAYQYILDYPQDFKTIDTQDIFDKKLVKDKSLVIDSFDALENHYHHYMMNVSSALTRYKETNYGDDLHIYASCFYCLFYNIILFKMIKDAHLFNIITHFWQYFSSDYYSGYTLFHGHPYLGIVVIIGLIYFIYLDVIYIYGIYYTCFVLGKYRKLYQHYAGVAELYKTFNQDRLDLLNKPLQQHLVSLSHRTTIYEPLAHKVSHRFDFHTKRYMKKDGKWQKTDTIIDLKVPFKTYYKKPMSKQYFLMIILLIIIEALTIVL